MAEQTKKSYNPFKMWGSWVGFGIGIFLLILLFVFSSLKQYYILNAISFLWKLNPIYIWVISSCGEPGCGGFVTFTAPIIYFLYGWLIHSLIRKIKNRNK